MLKEKIKHLAKQYAADNIAIRHHLHANPELSYQEFQTSKFVQQQLTTPSQLTNAFTAHKTNDDRRKEADANR